MIGSSVEEANHSYANIEHIDDLGKALVQELSESFVNVHEVDGSKFEVLDVRGPKEARRRIEKGRAARWFSWRLDFLTTSR